MLYSLIVSFSWIFKESMKLCIKRFQLVIN